MNDEQEQGFDFEKIALLLQVEEKTRNHPALKTIHDAAYEELCNIANPPQEPPEEEPVEEEKEDAA